ncbi:hypothetical protein ACXZ1K_16045 [Pedobacter sp. PWIIR3]
MKTNLIKGFGVFAIAVMAIACKKETQSNFSKIERSDKSSTSSILTTVDVYTGGYYNYNGVNKTVVQYWANTNSPTVLTSNTQEHSFRDIETSGTDLYVLATEYISPSSTTFITKYWKNGVMTTLTKPSGAMYAVGQAIAISGSNVYVAGTATYTHSSGYYQSRMVLWVNGLVSEIGNSTYNTSATDLVIAGTDVYVAGTRSNIVGQTSPASIYLKNGVEYTLGSSTGSGVSAAAAGSDVYMTCINGSYATATLAVYKNGAFYTSFTGGPDSYPSAPSIATQGSDVYLSVNGRTTSSGYDNNVFVWKNSGAPITHLISAPYSGTSSTPSYSAYSKGLRVSTNGDVYLLGNTTISNHGYWKNATFYALAKPVTTWGQGLALMEY